MGLRRSDLRGFSWEEYHYACRGYLRRAARQEAWFRNLASVWGGKKVFDGWPIPELDKQRRMGLPDFTDADRELSQKVYRNLQRQKNESR